MKLFSMLGVLGLIFLSVTGCSTPAYSAKERGAMIARNWEFERGQLIDDFDSIMLLRPASRNTIWNLE